MFQETDKKFQETDKRFKETEKLIKEAAEEHKETAREVKEASRAVREAAEEHKKTERAIKEMSDEMRATDRRMDESGRELDRILRNLGDLFGDLPEHLTAPDITEMFEALGFRFNATGFDFWIKDPVTGEYLPEIEILFQNIECMVAVSVAKEMKEHHIEDLVKGIEALRDWSDKRKDYRKIYGAIAGVIVSPDIQQRVVKAGFYVIVQTGDTAKIDVPEGFVPRQW
jgi:hypothetical protein